MKKFKPPGYIAGLDPLLSPSSQCIVDRIIQLIKNNERRHLHQFLNELTMKSKIIKWHTDQIKPDGQKGVSHCTIDKSDVSGIVVYKTKGDDIALLQKTKEYYGFQYLNNILNSTLRSVKFEGNCANASIRKAVEYGRNVYSFPSIQSLLDHRNIMTKTPFPYPKCKISMKKLNEQEDKIQITVAKLIGILHEKDAKIRSISGRELEEALDQAGYELKEKEKKEIFLTDYIVGYLALQKDGVEMYRVLGGDDAFSKPYEQRRGVIVNKLTFEQCCGILKMVCEDKFTISFDQFIGAYKSTDKSTDMTYIMITTEIALFVGKQFIDKIFNP